MIVPGSANPLLMAQAGDPLDEFFKILRSVRLRAAATPRIERTTGISGGDRDKWFALLHFKRGTLGTIQYLHGADTSSPDAIYINASDKLCIDIAGTNRLISSRVFRDPAAHYIALVVLDAANATASSRLRVYIADSPSPEITAWDADTRSGITVGSSKTMHNSILHVIGKNPAAANGYFDGYISEQRIGTWSGAAPALVDHCSLHPRTGQWRPKSYAGSYGTHGSRLDFSDASSLANLCLDRSGNGNNWTATNISLTPGATYDSMLDTPTNNFCTLNPLIPQSETAATYSNGNLTGLSTDPRGLLGTIPMTRGKWYWEVVWESGLNAGVIGVAAINLPKGAATWAASSAGWLYNSYGQKISNGIGVAYGSTYSVGDVIGVAPDFENGTLEFFKNGVSQGIAYSDLSILNTYVACLDSSIASATQYSINFGQRPFAFAPPTGFKALCTKNLPVKPPVMKSTDAFVSKTNSGANIVADLSAASPWSDWIRIYKRRDAAEGWRWQFSDDAGNFLDSSSTAAKATFPAITGVSYVGYALKVSAQNGVATGRLAHTNGVASVVTDGLANSRKVVMLRNEAGGNWFFYHPDLTAGRLMYMNLTAVETVDASINSVTASGFTVDAALASGTYRWIVLAEVEGFLKLFRYVGNWLADGLFSNAGHQTGWLMTKRTDNTFGGDFYILDAARNRTNVVNAQLATNLTDPDEILDRLDFVSGGVKIRNSTANYNASGSPYVGLHIAAFPFRYANAR